MPTVLERLAALFRGNERAHGEYVVASTPGERGKVDGLRKETVHAPVTIALWERHVAGTGGFGLGIAMLLDDGSCWLAVIDIDVYGLDLIALERRVIELGLPLVVCRTKSGGAHLYLFGREPIPAALARARMADWAAALGYPGVEVFPKQDALTDETSYGNWINVPYQAGERTVRYALKDGIALTLEEFLDYAEDHRVTASELEAIEIQESEFVGLFEDGPPCLETLARLGFPSGTRNNGLFDIGVYLRKRFGEGWEEHLLQYNRDLMRPPLSEEEARVIARSVNKKTYSYMCKAAPIAAYCDRKECLKRDFGVGQTAVQPNVEFGQLTQINTKPPMWVWNVNGIDLFFDDTEKLLSQKVVMVYLINEMRMFYKPIKPGAWYNIVERALRDCRVEEVPEDATSDGQIWGKIEEFCTARGAARSLDELLLDKPYTDPVTKRTYFRIASVIQYLTTNRISGINERRLYVILRDHDARSHVGDFKGKKLQYWSVPSFQRQTEAHDVPRADLGDPM